MKLGALQRTCFSTIFASQQYKDDEIVFLCLNADILRSKRYVQPPKRRGGESCIKSNADLLKEGQGKIEDVLYRSAECASEEKIDARLRKEGLNLNVVKNGFASANGQVHL